MASQGAQNSVDGVARERVTPTELSQAPTKAGAGKRSECWRYFALAPEDPAVAVCSICSARLKHHKSTTSLTNHIVRVHHIELAKIAPGNKSANGGGASNGSSSSSKGQSLAALFAAGGGPGAANGSSSTSGAHPSASGAKASKSKAANGKKAGKGANGVKKSNAKNGTSAQAGKKGGSSGVTKKKTNGVAAKHTPSSQQQGNKTPPHATDTMPTPQNLPSATVTLNSTRSAPVEPHPSMFSDVISFALPTTPAPRTPPPPPPSRAAASRSALWASDVVRFCRRAQLPLEFSQTEAFQDLFFSLTGLREAPSMRALIDAANMRMMEEPSDIEPAFVDGFPPVHAGWECPPVLKGDMAYHPGHEMVDNPMAVSVGMVGYLVDPPQAALKPYAANTPLSALAHDPTLL